MKFPSFNLEVNRAANLPENQKNINAESFLPPELEQARMEVDNWFAKNIDRISVFLEYKNTIFKLQYNVGRGYYHEPGTDIISLDLQDYQKYRDEGASVQQAIAFFFLHELSHLKAMLQEDTAGKMNMLAHFNYEKSKKIEDAENPGKFISIGGSYRQFYNILEDAIVNDMVLGTAIFGSNFGAASRVSGDELREIYVKKAFVLYQPTEDGGGDYIETQDQVGKTVMTFVGQGQGNWKILDRVDQRQGFDLTKCRPVNGVASEFLYFFMKNQMLSLEAKRTDPNYQGNDKIEVSPAVADVLNLPLTEAYEKLIQRVLDKYKSDPAKLQRYIRFMGKMPQKINQYKKDKNKSEKIGEAVVYNVLKPSAVTESGINLHLAKFDFKSHLENVSIRNAGKMTFLDLFNCFKERKIAKEKSWTLPLRFNLTDRTAIIRQFLEPIYTLLCILDDSFDVSLKQKTNSEANQSNQENQQAQQEKEQKEGVWDVGDIVRNNDSTSPFYRHKGVIREVIYNDKKEIESVRVDYFVEENRMSESAENLSGEFENVYNPDENLIIIQKKGKNQNSGDMIQDKRKKEKEKQEEEEQDQNENQDGERDNEHSDTENDQSDEEQQSGEHKADNKKDSKSEDDWLRDSISDLEKYLQKEIEADQNEDEAREQKEYEKSDKGRKEAARKTEIARIKAALKQAEQNSDQKFQYNEEFDEELIEKMLELSESLRPYSEKMAADWLEIINNVTERIDTVRDKYYRSGKLDMKKLQRYLPEIEEGVDFDNRLIYERMIERVMVELRPKMFRLRLLLDNSGSMAGNIDQIRQAVLLINQSLRDFRLLFKSKMQDILGRSSDSQNDIVCDTEIMTFDDAHEVVKPFGIENFDFLSEADAQYPEPDINREIIDTLLAFKKIKPEGNTFDLDSWLGILNECRNPEALKMLREQKMTEFIFQVSDGAIGSDEKQVGSLIAKIKELNIGTFGLAIGDQRAFDSLEKRHGEGNVLMANTPSEIAENFGKVLKMAIQEKITKIMEEALDKIDPKE